MYHEKIIYPAITIKDVSGFVSRDMEFNFQGKRYSFTMNIPRSIYEGAKGSDKSVTFPSGTDVSVLWPGYHRAFVTDKEQLPVLTPLLSLFQKIKREQGLNDDEYLELITAFVQSIPYDQERFQAGKVVDETHPDNQPRFPVETLADYTGVCQDTSYLLAALLSLEGYAVYLMKFQEECHMTIGIPAPRTVGYKHRPLALIETTSLSYVGDADGTYGTENMHLSSDPDIIRIADGAKHYQSFSDIQLIFEARRELLEQIDKDGKLTQLLFSGKEKIERMKSDLEEAKQRIEMIDMQIENTESEANRARLIQTCNKLRGEYNAGLQSYREFSDEYNLLVEKHNRAANQYKFLTDNVSHRSMVADEIRRRKAQSGSPANKAFHQRCRAIAEKWSTSCM